MRIRWGNILLVLLLIAALILWSRHGPGLAEFFGSMGQLGPGHPDDERVTGLIALGLVAVFVVAVVRILVERGRADE